MTIRKSISWILVLVGLAWAGSVSIPNCALSDQPALDIPKLPKPGEAGQVQGDVKPGPIESKTEALTDNKGNVIGTKTTEKNLRTGSTTQTEIFTTGEKAGTTTYVKHNRKGEQIEWGAKYKDGRVTSMVNEGQGATFTSTGPDGIVVTEKIADLHKGDKTSQVVTHPDGSSESTAYDSYGKPTHMMLKDAKGKTTVAVWDGKGRFTSQSKDEHGRVITTEYTVNGLLTGQTVKDKKGKVIQTTTITPDGKGGYTYVTKDKNGKVTKVVDKSGNVVSPPGEQGKKKAGIARDQTPPGAASEKKPQTGVVEQIKLQDKLKAQDATVVDKKLQSGVLEQLKKKPGEAVGLNPQPLPPGPPPDIKGKLQILDKAKMKDVQVDQKKSQTGVIQQQLKKKPGEAVGLNPQPLPPKDLSGPVQLKDKAKVQEWGGKAGQGLYQKYQKPQY